jgi:hypothetical protein
VNYERRAFMKMVDEVDEENRRDLIRKNKKIDPPPFEDSQAPVEDNQVSVEDNQAPVHDNQVPV